MTQKISKWQLVFILLLCRIFSLMTYVPAFAKTGGISLRLEAASIAVLIQALLIIPVIVIEKRFPDKTVTEIIFEKNKIAGFAAAALYLIFFIALCAGHAINYINFVSGSFLGGARLLPLALLLIVSAYCAYCGIEGLARSSVLMMIPFIIMIAVMAFNAKDSFDLNNFYAEKSMSGLFRAVLDELERNSEIVALAFLMKNARNSFRCSAYWLLAAKLLTAATVLSLITAVLGDYADLAEYPLFAVGSSTQPGLFRQNDALYLIIWTVSAVISIALFLSVIAGISEEIIPEIKVKNTFAAAAVFIVSAAFLYYNADFSIVRGSVCSALPQLTLLTVIPILILVTKKKGGKENVQK